MTWHVWGAYPGDTGPFAVYAAPDDQPRGDGQDWTAPHAIPTHDQPISGDHLGTVDNTATLESGGGDEEDPIFQPTGDDVPDLTSGVAGYFPDDAKGFTGRGVAITYGPA